MLDGPGELSLGLLRLFSRSGAPLPLHIPCQLATRLANLVVRGSIPCATKPMLRLLGRCNGTPRESTEWAVCFGCSQLRRRRHRGRLGPSKAVQPVCWRWGAIWDERGAEAAQWRARGRFRALICCPSNRTGVSYGGECSSAWSE